MTVLVDSFLLPALGRASTHIFASADVGVTLLIFGGVLSVTHSAGRSFLARLSRQIGVAITLAAILSSLVVVIEYTLGVDVLPDVLLLPGIDHGQVRDAIFIGLPLAIANVLLGFAFLLRFRDSDTGQELADYVAIGVSLIALLLFVVGWRRHPMAGARLALFATVLAALAIAIYSARHHRGLYRAFAIDAITARVMRPLLFAIVLVPMAIDHLTDLGMSLRLFSPETGRAIDTVATTLTLLTFVIAIGRNVLKIELMRFEATENLRASEARLTLQFDTMPIACIVRDADLVIQSWNPAATTTFGHAPERMLGQTTDVLVPDNSRSLVDAVRSRVLSGHRATDVVVNRRSDGALITCKWSNAPMVGSDGSVIGVLSMIEDITEQELARAALRDSEERYRQVVENMGEGLVVLDENQVTTFANHQFCAITDTRQEAIVGRPAIEHWGVESRLALRERLSTRQEGIRERYEAAMQTVSGRHVEIGVSAAPILKNGKVFGSVALVSDITDRVTARSRLQESEKRYRELVDSIPACIFNENLQDRLTTVNHYFLEILGKRSDEVLGRTLGELGVRPADGSGWSQLRMDAMNARASVGFETVVVVRGRNRRFQVTITPVGSSEEPVTGLATIAFDITDQRESEQTLMHLQRAVNEMNEVLFTTDRHGVITFVNDAFERLYGYARQEVLGSTPRILNGGQSRAWYTQFWNEILSGRPVRAEYLNHRKDGSPVRVNASVTPVRGNDGSVEGFIAIQEDVTAQTEAVAENRRLEERLQAMAKMDSLSTLAGGIAHDFNNILSVILSHISLIERRPLDEARVRTVTDTVRKAVKRGADLARQVLTFARRNDATLVPLALDVEIRDISSMISETFPRRIDIGIHVDHSLPPVNGDVGQIHRALLNLCVNARDAMPEGGTLRIEARAVPGSFIAREFPGTRPSDHYVEVTVSDTGNGMTEEVRRRIFEPFFTTKGVGKGTGLGLSLVYGVVTSHGGFIDCQSEPGVGTKFRLYFPAITGVAEPHRKREVSEDPLIRAGNATVLLIEDEDEIRQSIATFLQERGFLVLEAPNGDAALDCSDHSATDIQYVVTDLGMPGKPPSEVITVLRERYPRLTAIAMTGYVEPQLHNEILNAGVKTILQKPFEMDDLLRHLMP